MPDESVTVITVTRGRPHLLARAVQSVQQQDYPGAITHLVVADGCQETMDAFTDQDDPGRSLRMHLAERPRDLPSKPTRGDVYVRIAQLLNIGVALADTEWLAFLDDDNEFCPDHISSLVAYAHTTRLDAVHSCRQILWPDGSPYLEPRYPWVHDPRDAESVFTLMCERGIWKSGTNILRDRAAPGWVAPFRSSTELRASDPLFMVDQNTWLVRRALAAEHGFPERYSEDDPMVEMAPDDKFLRRLLEARVPIAGTGEPTIRYYLGGISN